MHQELISALSLLLAAGAVSAEQVMAQRLVYQVEEPGIEPYASRMLVTADHLRMDEGEGGEGYTLFDRRTRVIYNVDPADHTVLVIDPPSIERPEPPVPLVLAEERLPNPELPKVAGVHAEHRRLLAAGRVCSEIFSAPGLMAEAVAVMAAFYERLGDQHALVMLAYPEDTGDPCDLADHIYAPGRRYRYGLPLTLRSVFKTETLESFEEDVAVDGDLFRVPEGYRQISMPVPPGIAERLSPGA